MSDETPVAGWYQDPSGGPGDRWWDGERWTEHTRAAAVPPSEPPAPTGERGTDPTEVMPPTGPGADPTTPADGGPSPDPAAYGAAGYDQTAAGTAAYAATEPEEERSRKGLWIAVIVGVVIVLLGLGALVFALVSDDDTEEAAAPAEESTDEAALEEEPADERLDDETPVEEPDEPAETDEPAPVVEEAPVEEESPAEGTEEPGEVTAGERVEPVPWISFEEAGGPWEYEVPAPDVVVGTWGEQAELELFPVHELADVDEALDDLFGDADAFGGELISGPNELDLPGTERAASTLFQGEDEIGAFTVGFLIMEVEGDVLVLGIAGDAEPSAAQIEATFGSVEIDPDAYLEARG